MPTRSVIAQTLVLGLFAIAHAVGTQSARSAQDAGPPLVIVWPPTDETIDGERVRVGGRSDPDARVTVNGLELRVFASGAFAGTCPLKPGGNDLVFRATKNGRVTTAVRPIRRTEPLRTLPATPVRFDPNYDGQPSEDMEVRPGDTIHIRVKGTPDQKASFRIGSGETRYSLSPTSLYDCEGFYEAAYEVKPTDRFVEARITCYLAPLGKKRQPAPEMRLPGKITVNTSPFPTVGRVKGDYARLRAAPHRGAPLLAAREGTRLAIDGRTGGFLRVLLTPTLHGWLDRSLVEIEESAVPPRRGIVRDLSVAEQDSATVVRIPLGLRVPFAVTENPRASSVELTLFGVENQLNWIADRTPRRLVETIVAAPSSDGTCKFAVSLRGEGLFAYRAYYEGTTLCVALRPPLGPPANTARPLAGRTILLDAGHGGPSLGTLGSTGLEEKVVDLHMTKALQRRLEERGARVRMTRSDDVEVSLAERTRQAELDGDLFVSVHNNSIDLTGDPLAARGAGVFYFHPHSRGAAEAIYRRMLDVEPRPEPNGLVTADLYVVREVTAMPSVLLECRFLSNPEDEMLLMDNAYIERNMEAVAAGIADWLGGSARRPDPGTE